MIEQIKEALTLEELKNLHGKPVLCHIPSDNPACGVVDVENNCVCLGINYSLSFDYYGEWKAFSLLDELEKAQREIERLKAEFDTLKGYSLNVSILIEEGRKLYTEHTTMKEALEWISRNEGSHAVADIAYEALSTLSKEEQANGI